MISDRDINLFTRNIALRLQKIYPGSFSESHVNRITGIINQRSGYGPKWDEKDVVLITYGNSICSAQEKPLVTLQRFLAKLQNLISCVHILPFFPYTSDDGFAISNYEIVNPELGDWDDIGNIGQDFSLMFDLVLNHVSASHVWFRNFLKGKNPGKKYFIEMEPGENYRQVIRPRSTPLFTAFETPRGSKKVWTTFGPDQADLNFSNPEVLIEMIRILVFYISKGARIIRLDAVAFLWKEKNTTCLHLPATHEVIKLLRDIAGYLNPRVIILTETNVPNLENWSYFGNNDEAHMVYQFTLPPLILYTLFTGNSHYLTSWAKGIPETGINRTFLNFTASHDGIGVRPLEGIIPAGEIELLIKAVLASGGMVSKKSNPDGTSAPYELNISYMDALKETRNGADNLREKRFLCSQSIMLALQGIPAIYIHSLLGTMNDHEGVKTTGQARSINRRSWDESVILDLLSSETVHKQIFIEYTRILSLRRRIAAFHPDCPQQILTVGDGFFGLMRENRQNGEKIYCLSNISGQNVVLPKGKVPEGMTDLLSRENQTDIMIFSPYQTRWLMQAFQAGTPHN